MFAQNSCVAAVPNLIPAFLVFNQYVFTGHIASFISDDGDVTLGQFINSKLFVDASDGVNNLHIHVNVTVSMFVYVYVHQSISMFPDNHPAVIWFTDLQLRYDIASCVPVEVYLIHQSCTDPQFSTVMVDDASNKYHNQVLSTMLQFL